MKRLLALAFVLVAAVAVAGKTPGQRAQCKRDAKGFVKTCEQTCEQQLRKKKPSAADACRKVCRDQTAVFEKDCDK